MGVEPVRLKKRKSHKMKIIKFRNGFCEAETDTGVKLRFQPVDITQMANPCQGCYFDKRLGCNCESAIKAHRCLFRDDGLIGIWIFSSETGKAD